MRMAPSSPVARFRVRSRMEVPFMSP
jgi:hypothetical protein